MPTDAEFEAAMKREEERKSKRKAAKKKAKKKDPEASRVALKRKTRAMLGDTFAGKALDAVTARRKRMEDAAK